MEAKRNQMILDLQQESRFSAEHFISGDSNAHVRAWLARPHWPENRLWIWGPKGTGKSHILHIWARKNAALLLQAGTLSHNQHGEVFYRDKNGVERPVPEGKQPLCIDHLEGLQDEIALLHMLNRAGAAGQRVVMVGPLPPGRASFSLPDLSSRLRATSSVEVGEPEDRLRATLLLSLLAERQIVVPQQTTEWLWRHLPRTGEALVQAVAELDKATLERGMPVSIALAREVLGL